MDTLSDKATRFAKACIDAGLTREQYEEAMREALRTAARRHAHKVASQQSPK
jgi:hypothetical protein